MAGLFALATAATIGLMGSAGACPVTDPNCLLQDVDKTVDKAVSQVGEIKDEVENTAGKVVEDATGAVDSVKQTIEETAGPIVGPGTNPRPKSPIDPGTSPKGPGTQDSPRNNRPAEVLGKNLSGRKRAVPSGPAIASRPQVEPPAHAAPVVSMRPQPLDADANQGLAESALEAVRAFAFPLILTILVGAFLVIQHRVDRREPKLVFAPVETDLLIFE